MEIASSNYDPVILQHNGFPQKNSTIEETESKVGLTYYYSKFAGQF